MKILCAMLVVILAIEHFWFMILEMFLWTKPVGLKTFRMNLEKAESSAVLAANQGLYNGMLSAGLIYSLITPQEQVAFALQSYILLFILIVGVYGAWSVNRRILFVQAMPAALALVLKVI